MTDPIRKRAKPDVRSGRPGRTTRQSIAGKEQAFFDRHLAYSIMVLANLISRNTSRRTLAGTPLKINDWRVLRLTQMFGPLCAIDVINLLGLDKTTTSRAIGRLDELDLVELAPNPDDRRQTLISLTAKGRAMYDHVAPRDRASDSSFQRVLTAAELRRFHLLMGKLRRHAQQLLDKSE